MSARDHDARIGRPDTGRSLTRGVGDYATHVLDRTGVTVPEDGETPDARGFTPPCSRRCPAARRGGPARHGDGRLGGVAPDSWQDNRASDGGPHPVSSKPGIRNRFILRVYCGNRCRTTAQAYLMHYRDRTP